MIEKDYDCCVIGSGAGGAPVALALAEAGYSVLVLEKGPWLTEADFAKDEIACCRRDAYTPRLSDERHVLERRRKDGGWYSRSTFDTGWSFWNGNMVGGATNLMSGYFLRLKPTDFRLRSEYGPIEGGNVCDWPIGYDDLEPYYTLVETRVGVSGRVVEHRFQEPRSTPDFPYPPTGEHPVAGLIDDACAALGYRALPLPRAILSVPAMGRGACVYSNYCGSYGCNTGAKGSARAALLNQAVATGRCRIRPYSHASRLISDAKGQVEAVEHVDTGSGERHRVGARIVVIACQPIETARLLLLSPGPAHPNGLGNNRGQVGRNLLFSAGGSGGGALRYADRPTDEVPGLRQRGLFINRTLQDWYEYRDPDSDDRRKGGSIDFLFRHANAISRAIGRKRDADGRLLWGKPLKDRIHAHFTEARYLRFEVFNDWTPVDDCRVTLDPAETDRFGLPVARIRLGHHSRDLDVGRFLARKAVTVLEQLDAKDIHWGVSSSPPQNLVAGGCRFGTDPAGSVLDPDCRVHGADNCFVSDGSFMPTGGSVAYTWTIYANAFRVADGIIRQLGGPIKQTMTQHAAAGATAGSPARPSENVA